MTIESAGQPPAQPVAAAPRQKNGFERLAGVLFAPAETFSDIARKPDYLVPLLLLVLVGYISAFVMAPKLDYEAVMAQQEEQLRARNANVSDADLARMARFAKAIGTVTMFVMPVVQIGIFAIIALIFLAAFRLMGGEGASPAAFSTTLYALVPQAISSLIVTAVAATRETIDPTTIPTLVKSSAAFLAHPVEQPVLFSLLSSLDVFTIWSVILLTFGFAAVSKFPRGKSAAIVVTLWLVYVVVKVGFAALGAGMRG